MAISLTPNEILEIRDAHITDADPQGFAALKINTKPKKTTTVNYFQLQLKIDNTFKRVNLKVANVEHRGIISPLNGTDNSRVKKNMLEVALRFTGDQITDSGQRIGEMLMWMHAAHQQNAKALLKTNMQDVKNPVIVALGKLSKDNKNKIAQEEIKDSDLEPGQFSFNIKIRFANGTQNADKSNPNVKFAPSLRDASRAYKQNGRIVVPDLMLQDANGNYNVAVNNSNIHKAIPIGSKITGTISFNTVSSSGFGLSQLLEARELIIKPGQPSSMDINDFDKDDLQSILGDLDELPDANNTTAASAPAVLNASTAKVPASIDDDFDDF